MRICISSFVLMLTVSLTPSALHAQTILTQNLTTDSVGITVTPPNPEPYENVTVSLESYGFDVSTAQITWKNGSTTLLSGVGQSVYTFRAGDAGSSYVLDVIIRLGGQTTQKKLLIQVNNLDVLWEATNSYTPPFYKGKALPGPEAQIKVTAIPTGNPKSTVFEWRRNDKAAPSANGAGKQSFTFSLNYLNEEEVITVTARAQSGAYRANGTLTVASVTPEIIVYEEKSLDGIYYNRALNEGYQSKNTRVTVIAKPFFFSDRFEKNIGYVWKNGDTELNEQTNRITVVKDSNTPINMQVTGQKVNSIFEQVTKIFTL